MTTTRALHALASITIAVLLASSVSAQDLGHKAPPQNAPVLVTNATIHTISGDTIANGWVSFDKGVITGMGQGAASAAPAGAKTIDASGKHVYPGLIAPYTHLGLTEIAAVRATLDMGEVGVGTPEVRANVAVNPDSTLIPVARSNGVLVAGVFPRTRFDGQLAYFSGPGGLMPGRASVMRLDGWTWEDMTVLPDAGLVVNWPFPRPVDAWWQPKSKEDQQKEIDVAIKTIDDFFSAAKVYLDARSANPQMPTDVRFEAMRSVFKPGATEKRRQSPVFVQANDLDAIQQAVATLSRHELRLNIIGGMDAPLCAELLKRHDVGIIVEGTYRFPKRDDSDYNSAYTLPAKLEAAGIRWCLSSGEEAANERNLPYGAGLAVAHGLKHDAALKAVTLGAAQMLGVDSTLGSIEQGKSATLIISDGDILEITSNVTGAFIDGREIDLSNKQKALEAKYREKYRQAGPAKN